jgi:hypothetical protein
MLGKVIILSRFLQYKLNSLHTFVLPLLTAVFILMHFPMIRKLGKWILQNWFGNKFTIYACFLLGIKVAPLIQMIRGFYPFSYIYI